MDPVPTAGPSLAWAAGTVIQVDGTKASSKALRAEAGKAVYAIQTGGAVSTRPHQTVVYVHLTVGAHKACQAAACEVEGKALVVLALAAVLAREAGVEVGEGFDTDSHLQGSLGQHPDHCRPPRSQQCHLESHSEPPISPFKNGNGSSIQLPPCEG